MAHYAKVNPQGLVTQVMVADAEFMETFIDSSPGQWIQTSYNTRGGVHYVPNIMPLVPSEDQTKALRKNYACIGGTYDAVKDAFIPPKPSNYPSWVVDEETCIWVAPVAKPTAELQTNQRYQWNEQNLEWDIITYIGSE
jgi:hypothetical protein